MALESSGRGGRQRRLSWQPWRMTTLPCTCGKEKMATLYSPGARTSIPCLRRNGKALQTWGVRTSMTGKTTGAAQTGGPASVLGAWRTRTGATAGAGDSGTLPTPSRPLHGAQALSVRAAGPPCRGAHGRRSAREQHPGAPERERRPVNMTLTGVFLENFVQSGEKFEYQS
jgi:hypothetical protein